MQVRWQRICAGIMVFTLLAGVFVMPAQAEEIEIEQTLEGQEVLIEEVSEKNECTEDEPGYEYQEENSFALYSEQREYATSIYEAADILRQEMIGRNGLISVYYQGDYASGMSKDILEAAVAYDDSLPPVAGDYLKYHYNQVIRRTYKGSNSDGEYYRFEYEIYYLSSYQQEVAVEIRVAEILDELNVYSADRETQIRSVYEYIAQNVRYDSMIYEDFNVHSAYSAAIQGKAVCQGYSLLLYRLLQELGIKNRMIPGEAGGISHVWNIVKMNGLWYNMDVTWDWGKSHDFQWLLKGSESFDDAHHRDSAYMTEAFSSIYPMSDKDYRYIEDEKTESESEMEDEEKDSLILFIERLYELILEREPDKAGLDFWKKALESGEVAIFDVVEGFLKSAEFMRRENAISITPDILNRISEDSVINENAPQKVQWKALTFVYRLYCWALKRQPDKGGLNEWYQWLIEGEETPESTAYGFIFSQELINEKLSNEEYVKILYRVFMGREYDLPGFTDWLKYLDSGMSRKEVFEGFSDSEEFKKIIEEYGL